MLTDLKDGQTKNSADDASCLKKVRGERVAYRDLFASKKLLGKETLTSDI